MVLPQIIWSAFQGRQDGFQPIRSIELNIQKELEQILPDSVSRRLNELRSLKDNWDGEGASPAKPEAYARVTGVLIWLSHVVSDFRFPFIAPTVNGYAQLEWHGKKRELEVEATDEGWSLLGTDFQAQGPEYHEKQLEFTEQSKILAAYHWLTKDDTPWPPA